MKIIEIAPLENGAHNNQQSASIVSVPIGWAKVPETLETPDFPFGEVTVEDIGGLQTVTSWSPLPLPEEEPVEEEPDTVDERLANMEQTLDIIMGVAK